MNFQNFVLFSFQMIMMMMIMNFFCGMVNRRKAFSLISSWDHCQRSSPSWISDTPQAGQLPLRHKINMFFLHFEGFFFFFFLNVENWGVCYRAVLIWGLGLIRGHGEKNALSLRSKLIIKNDKTLTVVVDWFFYQS